MSDVSVARFGGGGMKMPFEGGRGGLEEDARTFVGAYERWFTAGGYAERGNGVPLLSDVCRLRLKLLLESAGDEGEGESLPSSVAFFNRPQLPTWVLCTHQGTLTPPSKWQSLSHLLH